MKTILPLFFAIFSLFVISIAHADNYGAIAYDLKTNGYGLAWDQSNQQAADQVALSKCATVSSNCAVVNRFVNNCGAYATGREETWGTGYGASRSVAENAATFYCNQHGSGCKSRVWACNTTYGSGQTFTDSGSSSRPDPDAAARNRSYAEQSKSWGGQQEYDRICANSPGGCN